MPESDQLRPAQILRMSKGERKNSRCTSSLRLVAQPVGYSETHRPVRRIKIEIQVKRETTNSFDKFACLDGGAGCHHGSLFFIPFLLWAEHQCLTHSTD